MSKHEVTPDWDEGTYRCTCGFDPGTGTYWDVSLNQQYEAVEAHIARHEELLAALRADVERRALDARQERLRG